MFLRFVTVAMLGLSLLATAGSAQTAAELLQKGIYSQETAGDLDAAIQIYRQVIASAGTPRPLAAQAQYRLAQCLRQKGAAADAAREFKKVIEGYPEERELVERARESILPLANYLDEDYRDPVLGLSFTSSEWPVSGSTRGDDGLVDVRLTGRYNEHQFHYRVDMAGVEARRSKTPSVQAWFDNIRRSNAGGIPAALFRHAN
jgi:tetratricopeptide (TPR) repeat protein